MRIGIDCRLWNESGVGRYVRNLVEQLQIINRENEYILFVGSKDYDGVKFKVQSSKFKVNVADIRWHTFEEQLLFPSILNRENLDLVHFPYFSVPIFYSKPYVVTIHDLILHHFPTGLASNLPYYLYRLKLFGYKFVIKRAAQNAEKIITVSNATKKEILGHLGVPKDKVVVTYEGIEASSKFKIQSSKLQLKVKSYFLYVGNAYPHKNLDRLIQTLNILISQYPNISLVLVGKEDYFYKRLEEKVKKINLERSVLFYGQVSDEELAGLYKNAKALVMPSLMEGFGLPGLEAMANKCLVLASDIPALCEVYGNAAMYFNPYDIHDIEKKMIKVLHSEVRYDFAQEGLDHVKRGLQRAKMFSWEKMAKETLQVYESCFAY